MKPRSFTATPADRSAARERRAKFGTYVQRLTAGQRARAHFQNSRALLADLLIKLAERVAP